MKNKKQYLLSYGFRRFGACRKLGWETIPCYTPAKNEIIQLPIKDIIIPENTRIEESDQAMSDLMSSIKQHGLLEPVGVSDGATIKEKDFLILNICENLHREDVSPFELSKAIKRLIELGLNEGEIGSRLSLSKHRVKNILDMTKVFTNEELQDISFIKPTNFRNKEGKLSYTVAKAIANLRVADRDKKELLKVAKIKEFGEPDIELVGRLIISGMTLREAMKNRDDYKIVSLRVVMVKEGLKNNLYDGKPVSTIIKEILKGRLPMNPKLVYWEKTNLKEIEE